MGRLLCARSANDSFVIALEAIGLSETSVPIYKTTGRHAPSDRNLNAVSFILKMPLVTQDHSALNGWLKDELKMM